jgi:hypothetical protein
MKRGKTIAAALAVAAAGALAFIKADNYAGVGVGYMAKIACSEIFLADRDAFSVLDGEFNDISPALERVRLKIDSDEKTVKGSIFGIGGAQAVYREGYGCTLKRGALDALPAMAPVADKPLPEAFAGGATSRQDVDYAAIEKAIDAAFANGQAATRALLVVKDGAVIAERYAPGFSKETPSCLGRWRRA